MTPYQLGWTQGKTDLLSFLQISTLTPQEYLDACEQEYQEEVQDSLEKNYANSNSHREFLLGIITREREDLGTLIDQGVYRIEDQFQSGQIAAQSDLDNFWTSGWTDGWQSYQSSLLETALLQFQQAQAEQQDMAVLNYLAGYLATVQEGHLNHVISNRRFFCFNRIP